ncbi:MAG: VanZ family protein [Steroidobacteraceae bacterium]
MLPLAHKRLWLAASALLLALVVYASLSPAPALSVPGNLDKLEHFGAYLILAVWFTALYPRSKYWRVAVGLLALGLALEVLQHVMGQGRYGDPRDMAANASGVLLGCGLAIAATGRWAAKVDAWLIRN